MGERDTETLLKAWQAGDARAHEEVVQRLYPDLKRVAAARLHRQRNASLSPTLLAHEAYLRLAGRSQAFDDRAHVLAFASRTMKHLLIDRLRRHHARKRGGDQVRVSFHDDRHVLTASSEQGDLRRALEKLARLDARQARVVQLRFFQGLSNEACAQALGLSPATVKREWAMARAWLRRELSVADDADVD